MEIKIEDLRYKDIINDCNIVFRENEITSIIGSNKSGKSTLLNLIYGFYLPDTGKIRIGNQVISNISKKKHLREVRKKITYIAEENSLFCVNALEDIKYNISKLDYNKLNEFLSLFELNSIILDKNYSELSSSEIQKVSLISGFLANNKILLLDNPTNNLDNKSKKTLIKILKKYKREEKIIIIVSNDTEFLVQLSDEIVVINSKFQFIQGKKLDILASEGILEDINLKMPQVINFENQVFKLKKIKLGYRDNINDLIKDIYRNAKKYN